MNNIKMSEWDALLDGMVKKMAIRHPRVKIEKVRTGIEFGTRICTATISLLMEGDHFIVSSRFVHGAALLGEPQSVRYGLLCYHDVMSAIDDFSDDCHVSVWPDDRCPCGRCSGSGVTGYSSCTYCKGTGFKQ
jgi:hypothetical protein